MQDFFVEGVKVPNKDGNFKGNSFTGYEGKIKVSLSKIKIEFGIPVMLFKTSLPKHIFDKLEGTRIERNRGGIINETSENSYVYLKKVITHKSLEGLVSKYNSIIDDYLFLLSEEKSQKTKYIFVNWKSNFNRDKKSNQNGAIIGKSMSMEYHFFVGFFNGRSYFDIEHRLINTYSNSYEKNVPNYIKIGWTQEREDFFNNIFKNFEMFKNNLEGFFETLDAKNIDSHISNFKLLN